MVTVLVGTLAPATPVTQRQEAEAWHQALQVLCALALEAIQEYGGTLQSVRDDGFLALFGAPVAQEDYAVRAVRAAWGLQQRLRTGPVDPAWPLEEAGGVRMGLHTGQILLGSLGEDRPLTYTAVGDTTQHAAWLAQQAAPGTILVSAATAQLVHGAVCLEAGALGPRRGPTDPGSAYQVCGLGPSRSPLLPDGARPFSRFVGRELELATLQGLLTRVAEGQGTTGSAPSVPGLRRQDAQALVRIHGEGMASPQRQEGVIPSGGPREILRAASVPPPPVDNVGAWHLVVVRLRSGSYLPLLLSQPVRALAVHLAREIY